MSQAAAGLLLAAAVVAYPVLGPTSLRGLYVFIGVIGVAALMVAVLASVPGLVGLGLLILFSEFAASLVARDQLDWGAPLYGAALLLLGELAHGLAARNLPGPVGAEPVRTLVVAALATASGYVVLALVALPVPHGELLLAVGAGVAAALVLGLAGLTRARR